MDGKILSLFKKGSLLRQMYYGGYEDFDGANGGVWSKYIHIPITTAPLYETAVRVVIDSENVSVYSPDNRLLAQAPLASEFWSSVRTDGYDIRPFDEKFNQLYFWLWEWDYTNKDAYLWVILPPQTLELNIAFGNPLAKLSSYYGRDYVFLAYYDAEEDSVNSFPSGWELNDFNGSPSIYVTDARAYQGSKSIYGKQPTTGAPSHWYCSYPIEVKSKIVVEYAVNVDGKLNSGSANMFVFGIGNDQFVNNAPDIFIGRINYVHGGDSIYTDRTTLTSLTLDTWYHTIQIFDFDNQQYKVILNDTDYGWFDFEETATVSDINRFHWGDDNWAGFVDMLMIFPCDESINFATPEIATF